MLSDTISVARCCDASNSGEHMAFVRARVHARTWLELHQSVRVNRSGLLSFAQ